jgi:hypothetical protein
MIKTRTLLLTASLLMSACVNHTWAPGPQAAGDFGVVSGQCKLLAMSGGSSNFIGASGSPRFVGAVVGGSILGSAVSTAVRQNEIYNACMESQGFVVADGPLSGPQRPQDANFDATADIGPDSPETAAYRACYPVFATSGYTDCMNKHGRCLNEKNVFKSCG